MRKSFNSFLDWLRLNYSIAPRKRRTAKHTTRLEVECLEKRTLPTVVFTPGPLATPVVPIGDRALGLNTNLAPVEPTLSLNPTDPGNLIYSNQNGEVVSTDAGATFTTLTGFPATSADGDTTTAFDGAGRLFWVNLDSASKGIDIAQIDPKTGNALTVFPVTTPPPGFNDDKEWMAADPVTNNLYVAWTQFGNLGGSQIFLARSIDHGQSWETPVKVSPDPPFGQISEGLVQFLTVAVGPDSTVYVAYHSEPEYISGNPTGSKGQTIVARYSNDLSVNLSKTFAFGEGQSDVTFNYQNSGRTIPGTFFLTSGSSQPYVLADPARPGNVYVITADDPNNGAWGTTDPADVVMARSTDYGQTWTTSTIDSGVPVAGMNSSFQLFPTAAIDRFGDMVVAWYDNRDGNFNSIGHYLLDVYARYSTNGGLTWSPAFQVNDADHHFNPDANPPLYDFAPGTTRIGEYFGVALDGGTAYVAWNGNSVDASGIPNGQQVFTKSFSINGGVLGVFDDNPAGGGISVGPIATFGPDSIQVLVGQHREYAGRASGLSTLSIYPSQTNEVVLINTGFFGVPITVNAFGVNDEVDIDMANAQASTINVEGNGQAFLAVRDFIADPYENHLQTAPLFSQRVISGTGLSDTSLIFNPLINQVIPYTSSIGYDGLTGMHFETFTVSTPNVLDVEGTSAPTTVLADSETQVIEVGQQVGNLDYVAAALTIEGQILTPLIINDENDPNVILTQYQVDAGTLTRLGETLNPFPIPHVEFHNAQINYSKVDSLTLKAANTPNLVDLVGFNVPTTVDAGLGTEAITSEALGLLTVNGNGNAPLILNDQSVYASPVYYVLDGNSFAFENFSPVIFNDVPVLTINGGSGTNATFFIYSKPANTTVNINGDSGTNAIRGPDVNVTWTLTGSNSGTLSDPVNFTNVQNLIGGIGDDTFVFKAGATISGTIDGGGGYNTLDYRAYTTPVKVDLVTGQATGVGGGVKNIQNVLGAAQTFTVTTTADSGPGSLRQAILDANAHQGHDSIVFDIAPGGVQTILPLTQLPDITDPVILDATTQPGYAGVPIIEIDGANAPYGTFGLTVSAGQTTIKGLVINRFLGTGILLTTNGGDVIQDNYIGTDVTGSVGLQNSGDGVDVESPNNLIGGAGAGNIISDNFASGVALLGDHNVLAGNLIGLNAAGNTALGNGYYGVYVTGTGNTVGGTDPGDRNVISGSINYGGGEGMEIQLTDSVNTLVDGNFIGTDATGNGAVTDSDNVAIAVYGGNGNIIGGTTSAARNVIAGHTGNIAISLNFGSTGTVIQGNYINTNSTGTAPNHPGGGIGIFLTSGNLIGGTTPGAGNLIEGGIVLGTTGSAPGEASNNLVEGNLLGTDVTGTQLLLPFNGGILIESGATNNIIGGTTAAARNLIAGGTAGIFPAGVYIIGNTTSNNTVEGNYIGTDITGTLSLACYDGVVLDNAPNNMIGGVTPGAGNLISGNSRFGVFITGPHSSGNTVAGNEIGINAAGTGTLANGADGILLYNGASSNTIGGTTAAARNIISGNARYGVQLNGSSGNTVEGNYIGTDVSGSLPLANAYSGVYIVSSTNTVGGTVAGAGNVISGNGGYGVYVDPTSTQNLIAGNDIGVSASGESPMGNAVAGIHVDGRSNVIGGTMGFARNVVSANVLYNIDLEGGSNVVQGNIVGTDAAGTVGLGHLGTVGILIESSDNLIGGSVAGDGNLISGNFSLYGNNSSGVLLTGLAATGNVVAGNLIGTDITGTKAISQTFGVALVLGANNNLVGTNGDGVADDLERNVISGNFGGVIFESTGTNQNIVAGNFIGTDITGAQNTVAPYPIPYTGVVIEEGAQNNRIGVNSTDVDAAGERNIISGHYHAGVDIIGSDTSGNVIAGNYIGTDLYGATSVANFDGVDIDGAHNNIIGGTGLGTGNLISGNSRFGVFINGTGASGNTVAGNYIGSNVNSTGPIPNASDGIFIYNGAANNVIGGISPGAGNVIAYNGSAGIELADPDTTGNVVQSNFVKGNGTGVWLHNGASANTIGNANIIISSVGDGVLLTDPGTSNNLVQGNSIGVYGIFTHGNLNGVEIANGASGNTIGTNSDGINDAGEANVISGNTQVGVLITGTGTSGNTVAGNFIGTNWGSTAKVGGNNWGGVRISGGATNNLIGVDATSPVPADGRNIISGNDSDGINIYNPGTSNNRVTGNYIGVAADGKTAIGNLASGVGIDLSAGNNQIGTNPSAPNALERNVIDANYTGVFDNGPSNTVSGNYIGVDSSGASAAGGLGNSIGITLGSTNNTIGGSSSVDPMTGRLSGAGNIISGNLSAGIVIQMASSNKVQGNFIGTDVTGTVAIPNDPSGQNLAGVDLLDGATNNLIGGDKLSGLGNLISGNGFDGVFFADYYAPGNPVTGNQIQGNLIGTDITGTKPLGNGGNGVHLEGGASNNIIGGTSYGSTGNLICSNGTLHNAFGFDAGVQIAHVFGYGTVQGNIIEGDVIGTIYKSTALGNQGDGVEIQAGASDNTIGGSFFAGGNSIDANEDGIVITGSQTTGNLVAGNSIGNVSIEANKFAGVLIGGGASNNTIGGPSREFGNDVVGNGVVGIELTDQGTAGNVVQENFVSINGVGVSIQQGASANVIGGANDIIASVGAGVLLTDSGTKGNIVDGNTIGLNSSAFNYPDGNKEGIEIRNGASNNVVGGSLTAARNVISGNGLGIEITGTGANNNWVEGNFIGTDATGKVALGNGGGVVIHNGAQGNLIGTNDDGVNDVAERNIISGNGGASIPGYPGYAFDNVDVGDPGTANNVVAGNFIGTDVSGTVGLASPEDGVFIYGGAQANHIGTRPGAQNDFFAGNVISANHAQGVEILGSATNNNTVNANYIGTAYGGDAALGNALDGVLIWGGASNNVIGSYDPITIGNTIAGNQNGVVVTGVGTTGNVIIANRIGLQTKFVPNGGNSFEGVLIAGGAENNTVGETSMGLGNFVIDNGGAGIELTDAGTTSNMVQSNYMEGNGAGVWLQKGASANSISKYNVIISSLGDGVFITDPGTMNNVVEGNSIGVYAGAPYGNLNGVEIANGASNNTIGGVSSIDATTGKLTGAGNVISGNSSAGVVIRMASNNRVQGNFIGTDETGTKAVPNDPSSQNLDGVDLLDGATNNLIGGESFRDNQGRLIGLGNLISGNGFDGVFLCDYYAAGHPVTSNQIDGNFIGTDVTGKSALANQGNGIHLEGGAQNNLIGGGGDLFTANVISGNGALHFGTFDAGVQIADFFGFGPVSGNVVGFNGIGRDSQGIATLGNQGDGIDIQAGATGNTIGEPNLKDGNYIVGNTNGIVITGSQTTGNSLFYNTISNNTFKGVLVEGGARNNTIGGPEFGNDNNVILSNGGAGIELSDPGTTGNLVQFNFVGYNSVGIQIQQGASGNTIGGGTPNTGNIILASMGAGVLITDPGTTANQIEGNAIGTDFYSDTGFGNLNGVVIQNGATGNMIGTNSDGINDAPEANVISGNSQVGVLISGSGTSDNTVAGNFIGTNWGGTAKVGGNNWGGVRISGGATNNLIGVDLTRSVPADGRNIISGNDSDGINIYDSGTSNNRVSGNYIGVAADGRTALGNLASGVGIDLSASKNQIGANPTAPNPLERNVIDANFTGVFDNGPSNTVSGNYIGVDSTGATTAGGLGNVYGITLGSTNNLIGGSVAGAGNIISGSHNIGIEITGSGTTNNWVAGNFIGTDATGKVALGNGGGVVIHNGAQGNLIGTNDDGSNDVAERNIISGNGGAPILGYPGYTFDNADIGDPGTNNNIVAGNFIGTDVTGTIALASPEDGVFIYGGAQNNSIGKSIDLAGFAGNVISGNRANGVEIIGTGTDNNIVNGNDIGTTYGERSVIGNGLQGVLIWGGASGNMIGSPASIMGNVIAGNLDGIVVAGSGTNANTIICNDIGLLVDNHPFSNTFEGVLIEDGAKSNTVGGGLVRNSVIYNGGAGIELSGPGTTGNLVEGNAVGYDGAGVWIQQGASANTIGLNNDIFGSAGDGVLITDPGTTGNVVTDNRIGEPLSGNAIGVVIQNGASNNVIGGYIPGTGNLIAHNYFGGVSIIGNNTTSNAILTNWIYNNGGLGIDLGNDGVTLNTPSGPHIGPDDFQNFPVLSPIMTQGSLTGTLNSTANTTFLLQFFANAAADPSGYGQAENLLGSLHVTTNTSGNASFTFPYTPLAAAPFITATATDPAGNTSEFSHVADLPLTPTGTTITSSEGLLFSGAVASFTDADPNGTASDYSATINWGDGTTPTLGSISQSATGFVVSGSHTYAEEGNYPVTVAILDQGGSKATATSSATVAKVPPTASLIGPANGVPGQPRTFTFSANDVSPVDQGAGFVYSINWGDGSPIRTIPRTAGNGSGVAMDHVYTTSGVYTVKVTATEDGGTTSGAASQSVTVQAVQMQGNSLAVGGTTGSDTIILSPADSVGDINVNLNGAALGQFKPTDHIFVYSQTGNDTIQLASSKLSGVTYYVTVPAFLYGGGVGKDKDIFDATGSTANNVLLGGSGTNSLTGGLGRNVLIAGLGASQLHAGSGEDILIGGWTDYDLSSMAMTYDHKLQGLEAIMAEWGRTDLGTATDPTGYLARVNHLLGPSGGGSSGGLNGSSFLNNATVHASAVSDTLFGAPSPILDWFFASSIDVLKNQRTGEVVTTVM